ncbi:DUF4397 domain-containing protein [Halopelagius longus]|nr:DUF4397 domain-containing protein [Halopelagius longus]
MKTLGVGGTVFAFGAGAGYAQQSESGTESGSSPFPPSEDTALVRALHASPDAPAVDIYVDGQQVAQGVQFGNITGYLDLSPGEVQVQVYPSQDGGEGGNQTAAGAGATNETTTEGGIGATNETTTEGGAGMTNETTTEGGVGAANETTTEAGVGATNETTTEGGAGAMNETTTEGGVGAANETANETGAGAANETGAGAATETGGGAAQTPSSEPLIDESVTVEGGQSYTVAAAGRLQNIEALVFEDQPEGEQTEDEQDQNTDTALVRAVNVSPDAGVLKVRAGSYVVGGAIESEEASNYADIQTGTTQVEVLQTGDADPIASASYQFEAGERYNLFLVGMVNPETAAAEGGIGNQTGTDNQTTEAAAANETTEGGVGAANETATETGAGAVNETTTEAGVGNETATETGAGAVNETTTEGGIGATNETTTEGGAGMTNETTTEGGVGAANETTTEAGAGAMNETTTESGVGAANETTTEAGIGNETATETGAGVTNETTTEGGVGNETADTQTQGAGGQTQAAEFQIVGVQDSDGSILEEAEQQTPSADDLLPIDLSGGNDTAQNDTAANATAENDTATNATAENDTAANATAENETVTNATAENDTATNATAENETVTGTATNGTATEAGNTTTSS